MIGLLGLDHQFVSVEHRGRLMLTGEALGTALRQLAAAREIDEVAILSTCNRTEVYVATADWHAARARVLASLSRVYHAAAGDLGGTGAEGEGDPPVAAAHLVARTSLMIGHGAAAQAIPNAAPAPASTDVPEVADGPGLPPMVAHALYALTDQEAARHLFRVAAGLESMVVGEAQILGQVRDAQAAAEHESSFGDELRPLFTSALKVGKRVRTETEIGRADVSLAGLAVRVAREDLGSLREKNALVIGAGRTSQLCAELLRAEGVGRLQITNRTAAAAEALAARVDGEAIPFTQLYEGMRQADVIISATAATTSIVSTALASAALAPRHARTVIVDLAVPPDVDPAVGMLPEVRLYALDALRVRDSAEVSAPPHIAATMAHADAIIADTMREFLRERTIRRMAPGIATLRQHVDSSQRSELAHALAQLSDLSPEEQRVVARFGQRLVDKMFHHLVSRIRALAEYDEVAPEVTLRVLEQLLIGPDAARDDAPGDA